MSLLIPPVSNLLISCDTLRVHGGTGRFCVLCLRDVNVNSLSKAARTDCSTRLRIIDQRGGNLPGKTPGAGPLLPAASLGTLGRSGGRSSVNGGVRFCSSPPKCWAPPLTGSVRSLAFGRASLGRASRLLASPHPRERESRSSWGLSF